MTVSAKLRTVPSVPFSPSQLPSLAGWYRGDDLTGADAAAVSQWDDVSGNACHATQATGGSQPVKKTAIVNGHAIARFDDTADHLRADGLTSVFAGSDTPVSIIAVVKWAQVSPNGYAVLGLGKAGTGTPLYVFRGVPNSGGQYNVYKRDDASNIVGAFSTLTTDTSWHVQSYVLPGTTIGIWQDGSVALAAGTAFDVGTITLDQAAIGAAIAGGPGDFLGGDLAELLIYSRAVSTAERVQLERHLGAKYAVTVA